MKKIILILVVLTTIMSSSYSSTGSSDDFSKNKKEAFYLLKSTNKQAIVELGDFEKDGIVYAVYGDEITGEVTSVVDMFLGGGDVYSFTPTYAWRSSGSLPWQINLDFIPTSTSSTLNFQGELLFY